MASLVMERPAAFVNLPVYRLGGLQVFINDDDALPDKLGHITLGKLAGFPVGEFYDALGIDSQNSIRAPVKQGLKVSSPVG